MFDILLSSLRNLGGANDAASKRRFARRDNDHCVSMIGEKIYPVENWSLGGFLIYADSKRFALKDEIDVTLKFKLQNTVMDLQHKAKVVRKTYDHVAFEFEPLSQTIKKGFQSVIDDFVTAEFANSQLT